MPIGDEERGEGGAQRSLRCQIMPGLGLCLSVVVAGRHRFISVVHEANKELGETLGVIIGPILNLPIQHGPSLESPHPEESGNPDV